MRDQGWGEEELAIERADIKRQSAPGLIWPENWLTANVFLTCRWTLVVGMGSAYWQGISAQEIEAACRLHRVPRAEVLDVLRGIHHMESAAQPILNEKK